MKKTIIMIVAMVMLLSITSSAFAKIGISYADKYELFNKFIGTWYRIDSEYGSICTLTIGCLHDDPNNPEPAEIYKAITTYYNESRKDIVYIHIYDLTYDPTCNEIYLTKGADEVYAKIWLEEEKLMRLDLIYTSAPPRIEDTEEYEKLN